MHQSDQDLEPNSTRENVALDTFKDQLVGLDTSFSRIRVR